MAYAFDSETCVSKCQHGHTYYKENDTCSCLPEKPIFNKDTRICEEPKC